MTQGPLHNEEHVELQVVRRIKGVRLVLQQESRGKWSAFDLNSGTRGSGAYLLSKAPGCQANCICRTPDKSQGVDEQEEAHCGSNPRSSVQSWKSQNVARFTTSSTKGKRSPGRDPQGKSAKKAAARPSWGNRTRGRAGMPPPHDGGGAASSLRRTWPWHAKPGSQ